jgi:hypothetical protein
MSLKRNIKLPDLENGTTLSTCMLDEPIFPAMPPDNDWA